MQEAEQWRAIFALQAFSGAFLEMDDLNVLRGVAGSIDEGSTGLPNSLVKDGDLLGTIHSMFKHQGWALSEFPKSRDTLISSRKQDDSSGNDGADTAADLGSLRQQGGVIKAKRASIQARRHWCPILVDLHTYMVAISRKEVSHDGYGGTTPDAM